MSIRSRRALQVAAIAFSWTVAAASTGSAAAPPGATPASMPSAPCAPRQARIQFPAEKVRTIWNHGAIPDLRMMPWNGSYRVPDPQITMQRIADGRYDPQLRRWFTELRDTGVPLMVEFGVEVNGSWFPWNGRWNGGGRTDGYGNPNYPDGPERFRAAYRHVEDLSRSTGADRLITWSFHVDASGWPRTWWNQPKYYYPGNRYVDWLAVSDYGEQIPSGKPSHWFPFTEKLGDPSDPTSSFAQIKALAPHKPFALIEFGVTEDAAAGDKAQWIFDAFGSFTPPGNRYDFQMVSYWSEKWRNWSGKISDLRMNSSPGALDAYRAAVGNSFFVSTPEFTCA